MEQRLCIQMKTRILSSVHSTCKKCPDRRIVTWFWGLFVVSRFLLNCWFENYFDLLFILIYWSWNIFRKPGCHLGKNGYRDVPLGRVPFSTSGKFWQGSSKIKKFQEIIWTGLKFCSFQSLTGSTFCLFSTFYKNVAKFFRILFLTGSILS